MILSTDGQTERQTDKMKPVAPFNFIERRVYKENSSGQG